MENALAAYRLSCTQATQRRKRAIRYVLLSVLLSLLLPLTTGCTAFLLGDNREAYDLLKAGRSNFKYPSSVEIVAGKMSGNYLYCTIRAKNGLGYYRSDTYCFHPSGYVSESSNSLCYRTDSLNYDLINRALSGNTGSSTLFAYYGGFDTMGIFLSLILLVVAICLNALLASKASDVADDKGYEKRTWFHMCFWLGPISYIIVAAMPDLTLRKRTDDMIELQKRMLDVLKSGAQISNGNRSVSDVELPEL